MHEHLKLHSRMRTYLSNLRERKLPREDDTLRAQALPGCNCRVIRDISLRADVKFHLWNYLATEREDPQISDQQGIDLDFLQETQVARQLRDIFIVWEDIHRHIDALAVRMCERDASAELLAAEIPPERTQAEGLAAEVDGIRAIEQRHLHLFRRPGRCQKFRFLPHKSSV